MCFCVYVCTIITNIIIVIKTIYVLHGKGEKCAYEGIKISPKSAVVRSH